MKCPWRAASRWASRSRSPVEMHERHARSGDAKPVAIPPREGRAGDDGSAAVGKPGADLGVEPVEPGPAVGVGQGCAGPHLGHVRRRMKVVAVEKVAAQLGRKQPPNFGLPAPAHAHHDDDRLHKILSPCGATVPVALPDVGRPSRLPCPMWGDRPGCRARCGATVPVAGGKPWQARRLPHGVVRYPT